jgi:5-methylcytosine-specific restriction endonuclease McrA
MPAQCTHKSASGLSLELTAYIDTATSGGLGGVALGHFASKADIKKLMTAKSMSLVSKADDGTVTLDLDGAKVTFHMERPTSVKEFIKILRSSNRLKLKAETGMYQVVYSPKHPKTPGQAEDIRKIVGKHDPSRNEYQRKYQKNRYHDRKKQAIKALGGKCVTCGSTENLELDHKDPDDKSFTITKLWSVPEDEFKREVKKCRLLCRKHHLKNTGKQRENGEVTSEPGKSEYGKDNKKKASASSRLQVLAKNLAFDDVARIGAHIAKQVAGAHDGVQALLASAFEKHARMDRPVLTWNVFDKDDGGYQVLFRIYGREKDASVIKSLLDSVKQAMGPAGAAFEYEDDLSEPGLIVKTVSGVCQ